jgi:hypothetical protein
VSGACAMALVRLEPFGAEIETAGGEDAGVVLLCCARVVSPGATVRLHDDLEELWP